MAIRTLVSYLVAAGRPLLVVEVYPEEDLGERPVSKDTDPVIWSFVERGMRVLPGFLGMNVPETDALRVGLGDEEVTLRTDAGEVVVRTPVGEIPADWLEAAEEHVGVVVLLGRRLHLADADTPEAAVRTVDSAAQGGRVVGAAVNLDVLV